MTAVEDKQAHMMSNPVAYEEFMNKQQAKAEAKSVAFNSEPEKPITALDRLRSLSTTLRIDEMEANMGNDVYIFDGIALAGQITLFYALPNTGKTLLFMHFLIDSFKNGTIKPEDVFYINADDDYKGLIIKTRVAEQYGFQMISPSEANVTKKEIVDMLIDMAEAGEAGGKVIILDTVKKFVNLMSKQDQSNFHDSLRTLIAKNASTILAGHANKYPDAEGNLIYEGTSDTMNDVDCVYSINRMSPLDSDEMVIEFRNEKNRGDVVKRVSYKYDNSEGVHWLERLKSVAQLDRKEASKAKSEKFKQDKLERFKSEVYFISAILDGTALNQSEIKRIHRDCLKDDAHDLYALANEFSERSMLTALDKLIGIAWQASRGIKNARIYQLIDEDGQQYGKANNG